MYFIREIIPAALILSLSKMTNVPIQLFLPNYFSTWLMGFKIIRRFLTKNRVIVWIISKHILFFPMQFYLLNLHRILFIIKYFPIIFFLIKTSLTIFKISIRCNHWTLRRQSIIMMAINPYRVLTMCQGLF